MGIELTRPLLREVTVRNAGPIASVSLDLPEGLTVLYGRNGAGKTQLLQAIARLFPGQIDHSEGNPQAETTLVFDWKLPNWLSTGYWKKPATHRLEDLREAGRPQDEILKSPDFAEWRMLPGNPWTALPPDLDYSGNDTEFIEGEVKEINELLHEVLPKAHHCWEPGRKLARQVAVGVDIWLCDKDGALRVAAACDEVATRSRFSYSSGTMALHAVIDDETPTLRRINEELVSARVAYLEEFSDEDPMEIEISEWLGMGRVAHLFDYDAATFRAADPPAMLLCEGDVDLNDLTIDVLERLIAPPAGPQPHRHVPGEEVSALPSLLVEHGGSFRVDPVVAPFLDRASMEATRFASMLLEHAPRMECRLTPPSRWHREPAVRWIALDTSGHWVDLDELSSAQQRWAKFSIRLALGNYRAGVPLVVLLDEPEKALHRTAERHLARGLRQLTDEFDATVIVATHSPAFLDGSPRQLVHIRRDADGRTVADKMPNNLRERIGTLGLDTSDLLQLCRTVVLVEGQHELVIFDELFDSEFREAGAIAFAIRGVTKLASAADAQLMFGYTNARLLVVVDNEDAERVRSIWERACGAADSGADPIPVLSEFTKKKKDTEALFLQEFCALAIRERHRGRIGFYTMSLPDIPEYLPVHSVASGAPPEATWESLHKLHRQTAKHIRFKDWMSSEYHADYTEDGLRSAVRSLDHIDAELVGLLNEIRWPTAGRP